nr:hypothetical protein [Tanacetum cinerariifolium]
FFIISSIAVQTPGSGIFNLLAVGTTFTSSGNLYYQWELSSGSGNALCILFPIDLTYGRFSLVALAGSIEVMELPRTGLQYWRSFTDFGMRDQATRKTCRTHPSSFEDLYTKLQASLIIIGYEVVYYIMFRALGKMCKRRCEASLPVEGVLVTSGFKLSSSENAISLMRNKDHLNACLYYMLYCLTTGKNSNLSYYIANTMVSVTKSSNTTLPNGMFLTQLFEHVRVTHLHAFSDDLYLLDHVMIPLSKKRVSRIMPSGNKPRLPTPTPSESSESTSSSSRQEEENDHVNNFTLDPIPYINQFPPIKG